MSHVAETSVVTLTDLEDVRWPSSVADREVCYLPLKTTSHDPGCS
jgi:hypothetical protein